MKRMKEDDVSEKENKIIVDEALAKEYARIKNVSIETAYRNLETNIRKESEGVDLAQQYATLIKAFRSMSPQLNGVVMREADIQAEMRSIRSEFQTIKYQMESQIKLFREAIALMKQPFYIRVWNRIKCLLKI